VLVAVASVASVALRPLGSSRVPAVAFDGRRVAGRDEDVWHAARRRLLGLLYRMIRLRVRSTPSGDADLLWAMAHPQPTWMVLVGYRARDGSARKAIVLAPRFLGIRHLRFSDMQAPDRLSIVAQGRTDPQPSCAG
jgi:hypothetical protein